METRYTIDSLKTSCQTRKLWGTRLCSSPLRNDVGLFGTFSRPMFISATRTMLKVRSNKTETLQVVQMAQAHEPSVLLGDHFLRSRSLHTRSSNTIIEYL